MKLFTKFMCIVFLSVILVVLIVTSMETTTQQGVKEMDTRVESYDPEHPCAFYNINTNIIGYYNKTDAICHETTNHINAIRSGLYDLYLTDDNIFIILDPQKDGECLATWPNQYSQLQDYFSKDNPAPILVYEY